MRTGRPRKYSASAIIARAKHFSSLKEWRSAERNIVEAAKRYGVLDGAAAHMQRRTKRRSSQSIELSAKDYVCLVDWRTHDIKCYAAAVRRGREFFCRVTSHMRPKTDQDGPRLVYVYEFQPKMAYIGVTSNMAQRHSQHKCKVPLRDLLTRFNVQPRILYENLDSRAARDQERACITDFQTRNWKLINKHAGGALGANGRIWSLQAALTSTKGYHTFGAWAHSCKSEYLGAIRHGALSCIRALFPVTHKWPKQAIILSTNGHSVFSHWAKANAGACKSAVRNGWLKEIKNLFA